MKCLERMDEGMWISLGEMNAQRRSCGLGADVVPGATPWRNLNAFARSWEGEPPCEPRQNRARSEPRPPRITQVRLVPGSWHDPDHEEPKRADSVVITAERVCVSWIRGRSTSTVDVGIRACTAGQGAGWVENGGVSFDRARLGSSGF